MKVMPTVFCSLTSSICIASRSFGVQGRQRLVQQQHPRAFDEGARQGDPLPLSAGQFFRQPVFVAGQMDERQRLFHAAVRLFARHAVNPRRP